MRPPAATTAQPPAAPASGLDATMRLDSWDDSAAVSYDRPCGPT
ncbi:hypothetical protein I553_10420 [Mycobacterium xenopi 4042]|uniref:Uncharacterized protein n=1 Tax=Mycobacterium xenopi 4042 TaxID=1299334 RepID=X7ZJP2_MYCXE|nr:hypothetical protein I553_10420 [Mycobacterium xenopi 4042]